MHIDISQLTYQECQQLKDQVCDRINKLAPAHWAEERRKSAERSIQRARNNEKLEAKALEDFATLQVGDIVKVTGVRDPRYPFREVTSVEAPKGPWSKGQFTGWQIRQNKDSSFERGSQHTSHMANKIRGVVHRAELELV